MYFLQDETIQIHQMREKWCPDKFTHGFYGYGFKRRVPGRPPTYICKWVAQVLDEQVGIEEPPDSTSKDQEPKEDEDGDSIRESKSYSTGS